MLDKQTLRVQRKYDKFSKFYDWLEKGIERSKFGKWRKDLLGNLKGRILEVGVGTGKNLEYYGKGVRVVGIDLSFGMLERARESLRRLKNKNIKLKQMDAQKLDFEDSSFDYVVCTLVLCSVPEPVLVLKEMKRVVKKNGKILLIEHMLSDNKVSAFFEHLGSPVFRFLIGCNLNRDTKENILNAGLKIVEEENLAYGDVFRKFEVMK